jgi:uncharacterized protein
MKKAFTLMAIAIAFTCAAQTAKPVYDAELAKRTGADKYGMKQYVMAFLKTGKVEIKDSLQRVQLQKDHLKNIMRLADMGKLVVAGPYLDGKSPEGIFIFDVPTIEEAKQLTETDPAVKAGTLEMELRPFYCTAALVEINRIHKTIQKKSVAE